MIKICSVVVGDTLEEFLKNLDMVQEVSNFVELRVDYIENFSIDYLDIIRKNTIKESIFTCRSVAEGGKFSGNKKSLAEIIKRANELKFDHVDVELSMLDEVDFSEKFSKIIGSYHNFRETPSYDELVNIYDTIKKHKIVDIVKIATNVVNDDDNIELVKLLISKTKENIIAIGMGDKGKITRIISPLLGGYLTFASVKKNISASGQFSLEELNKIYNLCV
ncbi:MAG: type I 3-dehydroquinate dehydratase [Rickettsiales bacterium]|nr:type I 3-dehydroquinate dehydratase [Rickettsiales bacterium]